MTYNNLIWGVGNVGKLDLSRKYYDELIKAGLRANVYTFGDLIHACAKSKNYMQALQYL